MDFFRSTPKSDRVARKGTSGMDGKKTAFGVLSIRQEHIYLFSLSPLRWKETNFIDPILSYHNLRPLYRFVVNRVAHKANNVTSLFDTFVLLSSKFIALVGRKLLPATLDSGMLIRSLHDTNTIRDSSVFDPVQLANPIWLHAHIFLRSLSPMSFVQLPPVIKSWIVIFFAT